MNETKKGLSFRTKTIIVVAVVAVLAVIAIVFSVLSASNYFYNGLTAVEVNGTKYTAADYNFFYMYSYNRYYEYIESMLGEDYVDRFMPTRGTSFKEQIVSEETGATWDDTFREMTLNNLAELTDIKDRAEAAGFEMPADYAARVDSDVANMALSATQYGLDFPTFLQYYYGTGMTEDIVRKNLELYYYTQAYTAEVYNGYTFTDAQLADEYEANRDSFDYYSFSGFLVSSETDDEAAMAAARDKADAIAAACHDEASLEAAAEELGTSVSPYTAQGSDLADVYRTWLSGDRQVGDTEVFESTTDSHGYYVFMFTGRDGNDYNSVNAGYFAVSVISPTREETDTDETYAAKEQEARATAEATAREISDNWNAGKYASLNEVRTSNNGKFSAGDSYTKAGRNDVGSVFAEWLFDKEHNGNDSDVLEGTSTYYVVIYLGEDMPVKDILADTSLRDKAGSEWSAGIGDGYTAVEKSGMKYTGGIWYERYSF